MRRRRRREYRPFPPELLAEDAPLVRFDDVHTIAAHLEAAGWTYGTYLKARVDARRAARGWVNGHGPEERG